jgi:flagellar biosynthesis protein FlhF
MVRTFEAKDMKDALAQMRSVLGEDAIILASETTGSGVLLSAAPGETVPAHPVPDGIASFEARYREKLLERLRGKRDSGTIRTASFSRPGLLSQLRAHRVPEALAHVLAEAAEQSGYVDAALALASALDKRMESKPLTFETEHALIILGPNGGGKTVVAAKLAAEARLANREVRLAATDTKSAGQRERLETFAVHLGVPVIDASSIKLFSDAVEAAIKDNALLIADTAGMDPRDPPEEILEFAKSGIAEIIGTVSASADAEDAGEIAIALAKLGASRLVVTGLDIVRRKGAAASLATSPLALAHATASPYLVEGLGTLTPPTLARSLLAPL